jgi:hypothetical protein
LEDEIRIMAIVGRAREMPDDPAMGCTPGSGEPGI